jgi:hypothetical protein
MAFGDELCEALGCRGNRVGLRDAQNVETFALSVGGKLRSRGGGV